MAAGRHKVWWSNADGSASREVNDEPTEAGLYPGSWGQALFAPLVETLPVRAWFVNGPWHARDLKYTGSGDNKRELQQFFDDAVFPPDARKITGADIATGTTPKPGQWRMLTARTTDGLVYPDNAASLYTNGCTLHHAAVWIWAPDAMEVALEFPQEHQNNLRGWLNDAQLAETSREGIYHTLNSPQTVTLQAGWNQLFIRGYALGYSLQFGAVVKADPAILWRLRLAATPPQ
jgi:hypothetical protein